MEDFHQMVDSIDPHKIIDSMDWDTVLKNPKKYRANLYMDAVKTVHGHMQGFNDAVEKVEKVDKTVVIFG